ncbi:MAG: hypothetical protein ABIA74_05110 [bacterium]
MLKKRLAIVLICVSIFNQLFSFDVGSNGGLDVVAKNENLQKAVSDESSGDQIQKTDNLQNSNDLTDIPVIQNDEDINEDREVLNSLLSLFGAGSANGSDPLQSFIATFEKALQEKRRKEIQEKFDLLPEKYQQMFLLQQRRMEEMSLSICFENCIVKLLNKIDEEIKKIDLTDLKSESEEISEILKKVDYLLREGLISFLISRGSLPGLKRKQDELVTSFYDYNQAPFFMPFAGVGYANKPKISAKEQRVLDVVVTKLKEFSVKLKSFNRLNIKRELNSLSEILEALSNKNLSKLIDVCLNYLKIEAQKVYNGFKIIEKEFENLQKNTTEIKLAQAVQHFLTEIQTHKKSLEVFNAYGKDLKIQKSFWSQLFNNFLLASYDLYGRIDPLDVRKKSLLNIGYDSENKTFSFFDWNGWKTKFFSYYGWTDRAVRLLTAATSFFDYYMALKALSLVEIMQGKGELTSLGKDGLSLLDVAQGKIDINTFLLNGLSKKELLLGMALFKAAYIYKVTNTFSRNILPLASLLQYVAAFTSYHLLDKATDAAKVFWPNNDIRIKNATLSMLNLAKKSLGEFVEVLFYVVNPEFFEKLDNNTLGILRPELAELFIDMSYPDIINNFPEQIAKIKREDRFLDDFDIYNRLSLGKNFVDLKKGEISRLRGEIKELKEKPHQTRFVTNQIEEKTNRLNELKIYTRQEYYEGKILGYLASSVGGHIGRKVAEKNSDFIYSSLITGVKGCASAWDKLTGKNTTQALQEMGEDFTESFFMFKEVMVALLTASGENEVAGIFLYNLAGIGLLSYLDAAQYYKKIKNNFGNILEISSIFDDIFDSVAKRFIGYTGRFVGSRTALWGTQWAIDKYGPVYPRVQNYFA